MSKKKVESSKDIKEKNKGGRPSLFNEAQMLLIEFMAEIGKTDKEISERLKIDEGTFNNWKKAHPKFFEKLKDWKSEADKEVEASLYQRALGYSCKETKTFMHEGCVITEDIIKHYPPDATSMIFWLKNRKPKDWRDKQEHSFETSEDAELLKEVAELLKGKAK